MPRLPSLDASPLHALEVVRGVDEGGGEKRSYSTDVQRRAQIHRGKKPCMSQLQKVPLSRLHESPDNPRHAFGDLSELAKSIEAQGIIEPPVVRTRDDGAFEIIAGHRRLRAAKLAGLKSVDVLVREASRQEALELALVENVERESLGALELAEGYARLMKEFNLSAGQAGERVGASHATISNAVALLTLAEPVKKALTQGKLTASSAVELTRVRGERLQLQALSEVLRLSKNGEPPPARAVQRLVRTKYLREAKKGRTKHQREAKTHGVDVVLRRRVAERLLSRVAELVERRANLNETDLRLVALALAETLGESARGVYVRRGARPDRLSKVGATQLRGLVVELALAPWATVGSDGEYAPAVRAVAKAYGLSLGEMERNVEAEGRAEALFSKE